MTTSKKIVAKTTTTPPVVKKIKKKHHVKQIVPEKPIIITPVVEEIKPQVVQKEDLKNQPEIIRFYGHNIRSIYTKNQWYFCIEDILKISNVVDPTKFLINLKNQTDLKDNYYQLVDSFSYQENGNPIIIPIINYQSFIQLLPYIRQIGSTIPGPFPDWLQNMANRSL